MAMPRTKGVARRSGRGAGARGFDLSDPGFAVATLLVLTTGPYCYPFTFNSLPKYWDIAEHLAFCSLFTIVNLSALVAYRLLTQNGRPSVTAPYNPGFLEVFRAVSRVFVWVSILMNLMLLVYIFRKADEALRLKDLMADFEGVNILTQSFIFFLGPFIHISMLAGKPCRRELVCLGLVLLARSFYLSERLALFEYAVPLAVVLSQRGVLRVSAARLLFLGLFVPTFFVVTEIFRSFYAKFVGGSWAGLDMGFVLGWNLERFFIYYADTMNKLYFTMSSEMFHLTSMWAGGVARIIGRLGLTPMPGAAPVDFLVVAELFGARHPEMTNLGGLTTLLSDFGWGGFVVYAVLLLILLSLHHASVHGRIFAIGTYPVLFITFVELPRYVYLYETRAIFPFFLFTLCLFLCMALTGLPQKVRSRA